MNASGWPTFAGRSARCARSLPSWAGRPPRSAASSPAVPTRPAAIDRSRLTGGRLRRHLHRSSRLARDAELRDWVAGRLTARWSPEQISRELRRKFPDESERWLCTETIYQAVYRPDLGGLPRELPGRVLHQRRRHRLPRRHAQARRSGPLTGITLIHDRPAAALDRVEPGHWEGDLLVGAANASAIVTLVERVTRCTLLGHLPGTRHDSVTVRDTVVAALGGLPAHLRRTLTWDQGSEMARHAEIAEALGSTEIYFCDPHSPWQRPSNENTNGLLRDYFPKGTDLSVHTAEDIAVVQAEINGRPRKVLGWDRPADRMATLLATTSVLRHRRSRRSPVRRRPSGGREGRQGANVRRGEGVRGHREGRQVRDGRQVPRDAVSGRRQRRDGPDDDRLPGRPAGSVGWEADRDGRLITTRAASPASSRPAEVSRASVSRRRVSRGERVSRAVPRRRVGAPGAAIGTGADVRDRCGGLLGLARQARRLPEPTRQASRPSESARAWAPGMGEGAVGCRQAGRPRGRGRPAAAPCAPARRPRRLPARPRQFGAAPGAPR